MNFDTPTPATRKPLASSAFVAWLIACCRDGRNSADKATLARLSRATSQASESQSWDALARFGVNLENEHQRLPYIAIGSAIAREKPTVDGKLGLGACIAAAYPDGSSSDQAQAKLRRLLACDDTQEVCRVLRPLLSLTMSRGATPNFDKLLGQLLYFNCDPQKIRAQWAQEFYRPSASQGEVSA